MSVAKAQVANGLEALVERIEALPPDELEAGFGLLAEQAGFHRHLMVATLAAAARSIDWAPWNLAGSFDLTPASVLAVESLWDRLPERERLRPVRLFALAIAHRLHRSLDNAPFALLEIAPDSDRLRDPEQTFDDLKRALRAGEVARAMALWASCRHRVSWHHTTETLAGLALADGITHGARAYAITRIRRYLEIVGREHRHPVLSALLRAAAAATRGVDPTPLQDEVLAGVEAPDTPRRPGEGFAMPPLELADHLETHDAPERAMATWLAEKVCPAVLWETLTLAACKRYLTLCAGGTELGTWVGETLAIVSALRELDGHEHGETRPRVLVEAARIFGVRMSEARARGATWEELPAAADDARVADLSAAIAEHDPDRSVALALALGGNPLAGVELWRFIDARDTYDPRDLAPLRLVMAASDEYRHSRSAPERFLAAACLALARA